MHLVLNLPLDGIDIDHFHDVPAGFFFGIFHFSDFLTVEIILNFPNYQKTPGRVFYIYLES